MNDINKKLQTSSATNYSLSDQDFGDPKKPKTGNKPPKKLNLRSDPYTLVCRSCHKKSHIPSSPINHTSVIYCKCGAKLAVLAGKEYGEKQRKLKMGSLKNEPSIEEIPSQII